ncbi:MICAL-like protein 1 isoform X2 [Mugil cephalus]|uniref:MICAL-like protein 1 isoform X2 n=1 Tax=Mugil cephalus TaxID=48193 RepID=UPI001FB7FA96|nr:MICAL-like protein 1 isoform X2 [Mugil cephalus]
MASPKVLQEWCRATCASYAGVEIKNMSTSFRDGLAFCAIIHKHRPDLIDFSSLSRDNVYQNNKLAFEVAETKLGIPALLDPRDMVSTKVPDCLSVLTYLSQYYYVFNGKPCGPARLWSSHVFNNITHSETSDPLKPPKVSTDMEARTGECFSNARHMTVCNLCFKPVHLIQRHFVDGKVYHRNCFRCRLCHSTLLPESYTGGSETGSLTCTFHITDSQSTGFDHDQKIGSSDIRPRCTFQAGVYSLSGLAIPSVPHYTKKTEAEERLVCKTPETDATESQERSRASSVGPPGPRPPRVKDAEEAEKDKPEPSGEEHPDVTKTSDDSSTCSGGSTRPVPAPRKIDGVGPVPAPRTKPTQNMNSSTAAGDSSQQCKSPPSPSRITSPKVKTNHPWMNLIHPGPWTQLPPAPAPVPTPRSKFVQVQQSWNRPRTRPRNNPFEEEEEEQEEKKKDEAANPRSTNQTEPSVAAVRSEDNFTGKEAAEVPGDKMSPNQSYMFPRSLSVPAMTSDHTPRDSAASCQREAAGKESQRPALTKSKTFQDVSSSRAPAPGHGFPLVKRRVQTDRCVSTDELQVQMRELHEHLETLERRGVELEKSLRDCKNDKEEEQMLMEWFSLVHERHLLSRRDTELVYLTKQQKLDDRQADVEYELRCLLNKPESEWTSEDRGREQQLMEELVKVIEQRNQIISSLEQDRQREKEEDKLWEGSAKDKDFQRERLKELKKSKGKFKPSKVFKILNHRAESSKESMHKNS